MKKSMAVILSVVLMLSVLPISVFATAREIEETDHYIKDTFVYEFERDEDGKFTEFVITIVHVYSDGSTWEENCTAYSNDGVETNYGTLLCTDTQDETPWVAGNTYQVESNFGVFNVEVKETPITAIEIDDVSYCTISEEGRYSYNPTWRVYYADGHCEEMYTNSGIDVQYGDYSVWYSIEYTDTQEENAWESGQTYQVTGTILGVSDTFNVNVNTVQDILVDDVIRLEGTASWQGHWDAENDIYVENSWMEYSIDPNNITLIFTDGTSISGSPWEISEITGYHPWYNSEQSYENQWGVGTHTATIICLGFEKEYNVIIEPTPIKSIDIQDVSIMEYSDGYDNGEFYYYYINNIKATITYNDDTVVDYDGGITIGDEWYNISVNTEIQLEEPWTVGNTYEVTGTLLGVSDTFNVTITASPVKSIDIQDVSIIENTSGWDNGEFYYYWVNNIKARVTLNDDTEIECNGGIDINGLWYNINVNTEIQYDNPWTVGNTYEVTGTLMGVSDTFNVMIIPSPVSSIEIKDLTIMEYTHGYYEGDSYYYEVYCHNCTAKITFTDGTVIDNCYFDFGNEQHHINIDTSSQYEEPWLAGNTYEATATLLNAECTFNVTITPSPVQSVKFKDIVVRQGIDSYFNGSQDWYNIPYEIDEIVLKNDEPFEIVDGELVYNGDYYWPSFNDSDMQWEEPWQVGNTYTVTGTLLGVSGTFNVTIVENPVESVEIIKLPQKTEYLCGEDLNLKGLVIRISYKDGDHEDISINDDYSGHYPYERWFYSKKLDTETQIYANFENPSLAVVYIFDKHLEIPVTTKENLAEQITLRENEDKSLTITVYNSDATSYEMKVLGLGYVWIGEEGKYYASINTDKGEFSSEIISDGNTFAIGLQFGNEESDSLIMSNKIAKSDWFEVALRYTDNMSPIYWTIDAKDNYNGMITEDNIDDIIEMVLFLTGAVWDEDKIIEQTDDYAVFSGDTVKEAVLKWFALENVDLSLSQYYDQDSNTYQYHRTIMGMGEVLKYCPDAISYSDGVWTVITSRYVYGENAKLEIKLTIDDEYKIIGFDGAVVNTYRTSGDANGDGNINSRDAAIVMQYANGWKVDINLENADANGDGTVNTRDYAVLMQYANGWDITLS